VVRSSPLLIQHAFLWTSSLLLFGCPALSNYAVSGVLPGDLTWPGDFLAAGDVLLRDANRCRHNSRLDQGPVVLLRSALPCPSGLSWNL
jgi:hypothetical protein